MHGASRPPSRDIPWHGGQEARFGKAQRVRRYNSMESIPPFSLSIRHDIPRHGSHSRSGHIEHTAPVRRIAPGGRAPWPARLLGFGMAAVLVLAGCGGAESQAVRVEPRTAPAPGVRDGYAQAAPPSYSSSERGYGDYSPRGGADVARRGNTPEGAAFANWVLSTDPQHKYIVDAFVRNDSILGVIVSPNMTKAQVQQSMTSLLNGMQRTFPNRPLEVIAYYVSGDELGRAVWDPRTRQVKSDFRR